MRADSQERWSIPMQKSQGSQFGNHYTQTVPGHYHPPIIKYRQKYAWEPSRYLTPWKCIDPIFTLRQILGHMDKFRGPRSFLPHDVKAGFDSGDQTILLLCPSWMRMPGKFILLKNIRPRTTEAVFVLEAIFHTNSPYEVVLIKVTPFRIFFSNLSWEWLL